MSDEPAYTPRAEYQCDGSTTHYMGCKCHEARRDARVAELELMREQNFKAHPEAVDRIASLTERAQNFTLQMRKLRDDIIEHGLDTYWCGPAETVCERITSILGDDWGADGDTSSLRSRQAWEDPEFIKIACKHGGHELPCPHCGEESSNASRETK